MKRRININVLTPNNGANSYSFIYPILANRGRLREKGIEFRFFCPFKSNFLNRETDDLLTDDRFFKRLFGGDLIFIDSKFFKYWWSDREADVYSILSEARELSGPILWFDTADSTGTTNFQVMPYVDGYYKNQVLKEREKYFNNYYLGRIFSDYYHRRYGIDDGRKTGCEAPLLPEYADKVYPSWNWGLNNISVTVMGTRYDRLWGNILSRLRRFSPTVKYRGLKFTPVDRPRDIDISARVGMDHPRDFVRVHRRQLLKRLERFNVETGFINHRRYYSELKNAKVSISPFGLGEICYRDFESVICGAALIKPDMGHVETWPDIYKDGETYLKCAWDFSDVEEKIEELLSNTKKREALAKGAQANYREHLLGEGRDAFCDKIEWIVERHTL